MQNDPEKAVGNYNEFSSLKPYNVLRGYVSFESGSELTDEQQEIVQTGRKLVNDKIDEILGSNNNLTNESLALPVTEFIATDQEHPTRAGFFVPLRNKIGIILDKAPHRLSQLKVFVHEYIHFISHNGLDDNELATDSSPLARNNNVGFQRYFGLDIRKGKEGEITGDYFLAFNEAVAEQWAIDILPGVLEAYAGYRGLLNQVIDDAVKRQLGSSGPDGKFQPWTRQQHKNYIYSCFLKGDLAGFTHFLKTIYNKYNISEQQFGLMTGKEDLPSVIEADWIKRHPSDPPSPSKVAAMVQIRLDSKTPDDYPTDIVDPDDGKDRGSLARYGKQYDDYVEENKIEVTHLENISGRDFEVDSHGLIVFRGEDATLIFKEIRRELDDLLTKALASEIEVSLINERMDHILFQESCVSMLSDGFRGFYIYKHSKLDSLKR